MNQPQSITPSVFPKPLLTSLPAASEPPKQKGHFSIEYMSDKTREAELSVINNFFTRAFDLADSIVTIVRAAFFDGEEGAPAAEVQPEPNVSTPATTEPPSTSTRPHAMPKTKEFLWKPISDKDGNLVVLLPSKFTGDVKSLQLLNKSGKVVTTGSYANVGNGGREHYRFQQPGSKFADSTIVQAVMKDGERYRVTIKDTAKQFII